MLPEAGPQEVLERLRAGEEIQDAILCGDLLSFQQAGLTRSEEVILSELRREEVHRIPSRARRAFYKLVFGISGYGLHPAWVMRLACICFAAARALAFASARANQLMPVSNDLFVRECYYVSPRCPERAIGWRRVTIVARGGNRYVPRDYPAFSPLRFTAERALALMDEAR